MNSEVVLKWIPAVVSIVGALMSVGGLGVGVWQARRALEQWRQQRHEEKRAEAAAEVLTASLALLSSLRGVASAMFRTPEKTDEERAADELRSEPEKREHDARWLSETLTARWKAVEEETEAFRKARIRAHIFLSDDCTKLVEEIWLARADLRGSQDRFVRALRRNWTDELAKASDKAFSSNTIDALEKRARTFLRPLAQMAETRRK